MSEPGGGVAFYVGPESKSLSSLLQMPVSIGVSSNSSSIGVSNVAELVSLQQATEGQPGSRVNILVGIKVRGDRGIRWRTL